MHMLRKLCLLLLLVIYQLILQVKAQDDAGPVVDTIEQAPAPATEQANVPDEGNSNPQDAVAPAAPAVEQNVPAPDATVPNTNNGQGVGAGGAGQTETPPEERLPTDEGPIDGVITPAPQSQPPVPDALPPPPPVVDAPAPPVVEAPVQVGSPGTNPVQIDDAPEDSPPRADTPGSQPPTPAVDAPAPISQPPSPTPGSQGGGQHGNSPGGPGSGQSQNGKDPKTDIVDGNPVAVGNGRPTPAPASENEGSPPSAQPPIPAPGPAVGPTPAPAPITPSPATGAPTSSAPVVGVPPVAVDADVVVPPVVSPPPGNGNANGNGNGSGNIDDNVVQEGRSPAPVAVGQGTAPVAVQVGVPVATPVAQAVAPVASPITGALTGSGSQESGGSLETKEAPSSVGVNGPSTSASPPTVANLVSGNAAREANVGEAVVEDSADKETAIEPFVPRPPPPPSSSLGNLANSNVANAAPIDPLTNQDSAKPDAGVVQNERPGQSSAGEINTEQASIEVAPSSGAGQKILNLLPNTPGYNRTAVQELPQGLPILVLAFAVPCGDSCNALPHPSRESFELQFKTDIAFALKSAFFSNADESKIKILNLVQVMTETACQFTLWPLIDGTSPLRLANEIQSQLSNPNSPLRQGVLTRNLDPSVFGVDILNPLTNDGAAGNTALSTTVIIIISVCVYLILMVLFVIAYRKYRQRANDLESQKYDKTKSWWYKDLRVEGIDPNQQAELDSLLEFEAVNDTDSFLNGINTKMGFMQGKHFSAQSSSFITRSSECSSLYQQPIVQASNNVSARNSYQPSYMSTTFGDSQIFVSQENQNATMRSAFAPSDRVMSTSSPSLGQIEIRRTVFDTLDRKFRQDVLAQAADSSTASPEMTLKR